MWRFRDFLVFLAFWAGTFLFAQSAEPYFFLVASDPQLFFKQEDDRNWSETISHANRLKPDFVIVCGDLIQADNNPARWNDPEALKHYETLATAYLSVAAGIDSRIPLYNVAGNHDVSAEPTRKTIAWYERRFGDPWYSFEHKRSLFIVLESNLLRNPDGAPDLARKQMSWLRKTLKWSNREDFIHKLAFMHHPLFLENVDEGDGYFNMPQPRRFEILNLFHQYGFRAVFSGHYHRNALVRDGDLELITTSSCGAALGDDPLGFRIVRVFPDRLEHEYYSFESVPEKVEMVPQESR